MPPGMPGQVQTDDQMMLGPGSGAPGQMNMGGAAGNLGSMLGNAGQGGGPGGAGGPGAGAGGGPGGGGANDQDNQQNMISPQDQLSEFVKTL